MIGWCRDWSTSREISRMVGWCRDWSTSREIRRVVGWCRDRSTFVNFFGEQLWRSPSVLHFVKRRSQVCLGLGMLFVNTYFNYKNGIKKT